MTTLVVGAGGLLGSAVVDAMTRRGEPVSTVTVPWHDRSASVHVLRQAFSELLDTTVLSTWQVAWCAGAGVVASTQDQMRQEVALFAEVLDAWSEILAQRGGAERGAMFLASSAGGVYAGSDRPPFNETTPVQPLRPYGSAKLEQEDLADRFARDTAVPCLIGRISNLYGPGQDLDKGQGLISAICRAHATGEPLPVYVSLKTCRDYLFVDDCADMIAEGLAGLRRRVSTCQAESGALVKVMSAGGSGYTIAELLETANIVFGEATPVALGQVSRAAGQVRDLRFASRVWPELDGLVRTTIEDGLRATSSRFLPAAQSAGEEVE